MIMINKAVILTAILIKAKGEKTYLPKIQKWKRGTTTDPKYIENIITILSITSCITISDKMDKTV